MILGSHISMFYFLLSSILITVILINQKMNRKNLLTIAKSIQLLIYRCNKCNTNKHNPVIEKWIKRYKELYKL